MNQPDQQSMAMAQTSVSALTLLNRPPSMRANKWGAQHLLDVEVKFASLVLRRIYSPRHLTTENFGYIVNGAISNIINSPQDREDLGGRIRNVVAATVLADSACTPSAFDYRTWGRSIYPHPPILHILAGAFEALLAMEEGESIPGRASSVAYILGSRISSFAPVGRDFGWNIGAKIVVGEIEQDLGKLIARVIERFEDIFVAHFLRSFRDFSGGFPVDYLVPIVDWIVRQVLIKNSARRPTLALLQSCAGGLVKT